MKRRAGKMVQQVKLPSLMTHMVGGESVSVGGGRNQKEGRKPKRESQGWI